MHSVLVKINVCAKMNIHEQDAITMKIPGLFTSKKQVELAKQPGRQDFKKLRNLIILLLICDPGLKVSEIAELKWQDLDLFTGKLKLRRGKNGQQCTLMLDKNNLKIMKEWRERQAKGTYYRALDHVFTNTEGRPLSPRYVKLLFTLFILNTVLPVNIMPITLPGSRSRTESGTDQ